MGMPFFPTRTNLPREGVAQGKLKKKKNWRNTSCLLVVCCHLQPHFFHAISSFVQSLFCMSVSSSMTRLEKTSKNTCSCVVVHFWFLSVLLLLLLTLFNRCFACQCRNHCASLSCFSSLPDKKKKIEIRHLRYMQDVTWAQGLHASRVGCILSSLLHTEFKSLLWCSDLGYNRASFAVFSLAAMVVLCTSRMIV